MFSISSMHAGTIEMGAVLGASSEASLEKFKTFLAALEVYGTGY
jgi:hypothetical protein